MSIFPDWIEIDVATGGTVVVDTIEVEMVDDTIEIEMEAAIEVEVIDDTIEVEVC